ncbi:reverse transcriptase [Gossypium australe]|uniref:Reverse transcriptase n=1 Tax=Gossypium australe TaxID=47621 RepID=A0A5B6V8T0_9ROSI|nr:reverse transcriptase [Gossypium australe]
MIVVSEQKKYCLSDIRINLSLLKLAEVYIREIVRLHSFHKSLSTTLNFSIAFHLQTNGQSEHVIQILEDMLRACIIDFESGWECYLPLAEFVYNNSFQSSNQMALYKALYDCRSRTPICWSDLCERKVVGPKLIQETEDIAKVIQDRLKKAFNRKKSYVDLKRQYIEFFVEFTVEESSMIWSKGKVEPLIYQTGRTNCVLVGITGRVIENTRCFSCFNAHEIMIGSVLHYLDERNRNSARLVIRGRTGQNFSLEVKELQNKCVSLVKVLWHSHSVKEAIRNLNRRLDPNIPTSFKSYIKSELNFGQLTLTQISRNRMEKTKLSTNSSEFTDKKSSGLLRLRFDKALCANLLLLCQ